MMNEENLLATSVENPIEQMPPSENISTELPEDASLSTDASAVPYQHETSSPVEVPFSELKELVLAATKKLDGLAQELSYSTKFAEKKQDQIDKLYEENRAYKDELIEQFKAKLVLGVIEQLDRADKQVRTFEEKEESEKNYRNLLDSFRELTEEFRDMLQNRFNIDHFQTQPGKPFDPKRHKPFGTVPTGDAEKDKTVVQSRRHGYQQADGRILRQEFVEVYFHDPALASKPVPVPPPLQGNSEIPNDSENLSDSVVEKPNY